MTKLLSLNSESARIFKKLLVRGIDNLDIWQVHIDSESENHVYLQFYSHQRDQQSQ